MNYRLTWFLRRHAAEAHSSEDVADAVGISLKQLHADLAMLRERGFEFDEHPTMGLRLMGTPEAIDPVEVAFARQGKRLGREVEVHDRVGSTNDVAAERVGRGLDADGLVVVAEEQTAGRGRRGAAWFGARGRSLLLSVVHQPPGEGHGPAEMMLAAATGTAGAIEQVTGLRVGIKWPNDVEIDRHKVAGILVERASAEGGIAGRRQGDSRGEGAFLIGIGVNVNQEEGAFPPEIADSALSLLRAAGRPIDRTLLLEAILKHLETCLADAEGQGRAGLLESYMGRCDMVGRQVTVRDAGTSFHGTVVAISPDYALLLRLEGGGYRSFDAFNVRLV